MALDTGRILAAMAEPMEAVIISGPRRGEIIRLPEGAGEPSPEELQALNEALDLLNPKLENLSREFRAGAEAIRPRSEVP